MLSDYSLDLNSETMISFLEMENVQEVETVEKKPVFKEQVTRPSVIMKPMKEMKKEAKVPNLADILTSCGIEYDLVDSPEHSPVQSPSSIHSDMELEKTQELIDELEEFFMKTDGTPTVVDEEVIELLHGDIGVNNLFIYNCWCPISLHEELLQLINQLLGFFQLHVTVNAAW